MKALGIDIDDRLTFDGHISNMCIKAGRQLNVLQRLKGSLDQDSRMAIYRNFIMYNFNYCPLIWMFTCKTSLSKLENIQNGLLDLYLMTINRAILISYRMLTYLELKLCSCDISQLKFSSVLTKSTLLILMQCSYVKNVHMRWETALFWWDRKLTWHRTVWNPSEVTARKHLPVSYKVRISLNELKKMIKSWDGPKCKCSVCALYTWPDLLLSTHYIVLHKRLYVCVYMWIYVCMYIYIYTYIVYHISRHFCMIYVFYWYF